MPVHLSPGVYVEELSSGPPRIEEPPTAIAAFVGLTTRGRDNRATRIDSLPDFERLLGGLASDSLVSYAVRQFYDNGGGTAYVVRVPRSDAVAAAIAVKDATHGGSVALTITALSRGAGAHDVVVDIDHDVPGGDLQAFNLTVTDLTTGGVERFGNVTLDDTRTNAIEAVVNDATSGSMLVSVAAGSTTGRPVETGLVGGAIDLAAIAGLSAATPHRIRLTMDVPAGLQVDLDVFSVGEPRPTSVAGLCSALGQKVNAALGAHTAGARVRCVPTTTGTGIRLLTDNDPALLPDALDATITVDSPGANSIAETLALTAASAMSANVGRYRLGLGRTTLASSGPVVGDDGTTPPGTTDLMGSRTAGTGMYALDEVDLFDLLVIPEATRPAADDPDARDTSVDHVAVYTRAIQYCEQRRAMLLCDPPPDVDGATAAGHWITNELTLVGSNAAAYFPRILAPDPLDGGALRAFGPSGAIAGLIARIDDARGVWKAPAGAAAGLAGVRSLAVQLTDAENGMLNPLGLNCLRTFPTLGHVVWGARTIDGADVTESEWAYLSVRRLALAIEEAVVRGTSWAVFQANDAHLWQQLQATLTNYMNGLFRQGAFAGSSPDEAYVVRCDSTTTTQADIDGGIVTILVGFAPLKPAEFIILTIQQRAGQTQP